MELLLALPSWTSAACNWSLCFTSNTYGGKFNSKITLIPQGRQVSLGSQAPTAHLVLWHARKNMTGAIKTQSPARTSYRGESSEGQGIRGSSGHSIVELAQEMLTIWEPSSGAEIALILLAHRHHWVRAFRNSQGLAPSRGVPCLPCPPCPSCQSFLCHLAVGKIWLATFDLLWKQFAAEACTSHTSLFKKQFLLGQSRSILRPKQTMRVWKAWPSSGYLTESTQGQNFVSAALFSETWFPEVTYQHRKEEAAFTVLPWRTPQKCRNLRSKPWDPPGVSWPVQQRFEYLSPTDPEKSQDPGSLSAPRRPTTGSESSH